MQGVQAFRGSRVTRDCNTQPRADAAPERPPGGEGRKRDRTLSSVDAAVQHGLDDAVEVSRPLQNDKAIQSEEDRAQAIKVTAATRKEERFDSSHTERCIMNPIFEELYQPLQNTCQTTDKGAQ